MTDTLGIGAFTPNAFSSQYMFDDLDMLDYGSTSPIMGASVFGGGFAAPPVMGMGMGFSNQSYYDNMKDYQRFSIDYNIDQQRMNRNADMRINASMEAVKGSATTLKDKIMKNEQDQVKEAYDNYLKTVAAAYGDGTPQEIAARAKSLYAQMNGGKTLVQDLREYGHGSFTQGMLNSLALGTYYRHSAEDNVSYVTGAPVATGEKASQNLGRLTGAGVAGGLAFGAAKGLGKMLPKLGAKAGVVGLGVAAGAALLSFITGKVTT